MQAGHRTRLVLGAANNGRIVVGLQLLLDPGGGKNDLEQAGHQLRLTPIGTRIAINLSQKIVSHPRTTTASPQLIGVILAVNPQKDKADLKLNYGTRQIVPQIELHQHDRQATAYFQHEST